MNSQKSTLPLIFLIPLLVVLLLLSALHTSTNAAPNGTLTVNTLADDENDGCGTNNCTLREAIEDAVAGDVINFSTSGTIDISGNGQLTIDKDLTINGGNVITVSGGNTTRVFAATNGNITFDSLVIAYGNDQGTDCYGSACGGGLLIMNSGGGGNDVVSIVNSTIFSNTTSGHGGGIYNFESQVTVSNSTIMNNSAMGGNGGGIHSANWGYNTIDNSTFISNTAVFDGGGIYAMGIGNNVTINNSTFSGNTAGGTGGGIYNTGNSMFQNFLSLRNSTLSGNVATAGGGIDNYGRLNLSNTLIANTPSGTDCRSSNGLGLDDNNLIEVNDNCGTPVSTADPLLGSLQDNGGSTLTFELLTGSPAIDAGDNASCLLFDQRGVERPQDGDDNGTSTCDIGSYEVEQICTEPYVVMNTNSSGAGSLRQTITDVCLGGIIIFENSLSGSTIDLSSGSPITGQLTISKSLTISGSVPITISGGNASRVFKVTYGNVTFDSITIADGNDQSTDCSGDASCGGGISIQGSNAVVTISNSTLVRNTSGYGGGIYNSLGSMILNNSTISDNSGRGGGIYHSGGSMILNNSTVSNNSGGGIFIWYGMVTINNSIFLSNSGNYVGGGIHNHIGTISINDSTISDNSGSGGGVCNSSGAVTINNSTLSGNSSGSVGGGIYNGEYSHSKMIINNSTISGNFSGYSGGGIFNEDGLVNINSSTVTNNRVGGIGGGILSAGGNTTITNTIVSGNIVSDTAAASDLAYSGFSSGGYNLIGTMEANVTAFIDGVNGDQTGVNSPGLGPLADNGGPATISGQATFTHALLPNSSAIDTGAYCDATDQRGVPRPQDGDGDTVAVCDIGAFEVGTSYMEFVFLPVVIK